MASEKAQHARRRKVGLDDYVAANGATAEDVDGLPRQDIPPSGRYVVRRGRLCRVRHTRDGVVYDDLANFSAKIIEESIVDDGLEPARVFTVAGRLADGTALPPVSVPAARFAGMGWVTDAWGRRAAVSAGMSARECLREAIQLLSGDAVERHVFAHTGWRPIDGRMVYITNGLPGVDVDLGPDLARYAVPAVPDEPVGAMRASLDLLRSGVAPDAIMAPLWCIAYRAPTTSVLPLDAALWLHGPTGSMKSTLAALVLNLYGASFDRLHLPASFTSTVNAIERRAFALKDVLLVVDDYAPSGLDAKEHEAKAARLLRAIGNRSARSRLRSDLTMRPDFVPRGALLCTGEQQPPGMSVVARTLAIELDRGRVDIAALSTAQASAARLPHAMSAFVRWLAPQVATLDLAEAFSALRARATTAGAHRRTPEAIAHLALGAQMALDCAVALGACSEGEGAELFERVWRALEAVGNEQGATIQGESPSRRFVTVLASLCEQRKAALVDRALGGDAARAELLGWQDLQGLYLLPEAAFNAVHHHCRESSEPFPVRQRTLRRDLVREALIETTSDNECTVPVRIGGRQRRVLFLRRAAVEAILGVPFPEPPPPPAGAEV